MRFLYLMITFKRDVLCYVATCGVNRARNYNIEKRRKHFFRRITRTLALSTTPNSDGQCEQFYTWALPGNIVQVAKTQRTSKWNKTSRCFQFTANFLFFVIDCNTLIRIIIKSKKEETHRDINQTNVTRFTVSKNLLAVATFIGYAQFSLSVRRSFDFCCDFQVHLPRDWPSRHEHCPSRLRRRRCFLYYYSDFA